MFKSPQTLTIKTFDVPSVAPNDNQHQNPFLRHSAELLPLLGRIAAGIPIEAIEDKNREELLALLTAPGRYALKVSGDSMIDAGIYDHDTIIVQSQQQAKNGDIVVALVDNEYVTLKRIRYIQYGQIELIADNPSIPNQNYATHRITIQGKVVGQIRQYS